MKQSRPTSVGATVSRTPGGRGGGSRRSRSAAVSRSRPSPGWSTTSTRSAWARRKSRAPWSPRALAAAGAASAASRTSGCAHRGRSAPAASSAAPPASHRDAVTRPGRCAARRRATSSGPTPGWSTCATTTRAGTRSRAAATPTRRDDAIPVAQSGLSTTRTPGPSSDDPARTRAASAPSTTTTASHPPASRVAVACSTSVPPRWGSSALGPRPRRVPAPAARRTATVGVAGAVVGGIGTRPG